MWFGFFLLVLGLAAAGLGFGGLSFIPSNMVVGWSALFTSVLLAVFGVWFLIRLFGWLLRLTIGAAMSPAGDRFGKLLAIAVGVLAISSIPLFLWDAAIRILSNLFGRNPSYESFLQLARAGCDWSSQSCIARTAENALTALWRFFQSLLVDLNLGRFPLLDLFWFVLIVAAAALSIAVIKNSAEKTVGQYSLATLRDAIPAPVRERMPLAILLMIAFYLGLSAMFAIPVLRGARDIVASPDDVAKRLVSSTETVGRLIKLDVGLVPIDFGDQLPPVPGTPPPAGTLPSQSGGAGQAPPVAAASADRIASAKSYAAGYDRQRNEFRRVLDTVPDRLRQLSSETIGLATSSSRTFLGQRDRDRYVTAVIDHHSAIVSRYESGLYACRKALIELREEIEQFKTARPEASPRVSVLGFNFSAGTFSDVDRTASESVRICQVANSPDRIAPKLPPDPLEILGPFGATVRWLTATDSRAIATIVGMIGFGLLGATLSRMIRRSEKTEGPLAGMETVFVVAGGVTAAFVVFLGSYAMLGDQSSEANPYVVFVTSLVGAVFSEDIWRWARKKFTPKDEAEKDEPKPAPKNGASTSAGDDKAPRSAGGEPGPEPATTPTAAAKSLAEPPAATVPDEKTKDANKGWTAYARWARSHIGGA